MIQAIIFDIGGVLVCTEDPQPRAQAEQRLDLTPGGAEALVLNSAMGKRAQRGEITTDALWAWTGEQLALDNEALAAFRHDFWAGDRLDTDLADYIRSLRPRYQTAILSNFYDDQPQMLSEDYPILDAFDIYVCSALVGVMKPDAKIYEITLSRLERKPKEAVFIDDSLANIEAARAVGMHAIHYTPQVDVPAALAELGVSPSGGTW